MEDNTAYKGPKRVEDLSPEDKERLTSRLKMRPEVKRIVKLNPFWEPTDLDLLREYDEEAKQMAEAEEKHQQALAERRRKDKERRALLRVGLDPAKVREERKAEEKARREQESMPVLKRKPEAEPAQLDDLIGRIEETAKESSSRVLTVDDMLKANKERISRLRLDGIDQKTGEGLPAHTVRVEIPDYPIRVQWLTEEVAGNKLYKKVVALGSIEAYVEYANAIHAARLADGARLTADMVVQKLMEVRLERDPAFAFIMCFFIKNKATGKTVPFKLNYPQIMLLEKLEEMRRAGEPIRLILLKARQWGGSTCVQLYMAWIQMFLKTGWNSVIIAQTKDTSRRIKAMYSLALREFKFTKLLFKVPKLKFSPKEGSTADYTITDENGRVVRENAITIASFENFEATRGADFAMAHYSEVAYWVNTPGKTAESLITNISGGMLLEPLTIEVLESTANGMSGYFYDEYQIAKDPEIESARKALFIPFFYILQDTKAFKDEAEEREFAERLLENRDKELETSTTVSGAYLFSLWRKGASLESINWYVKKRASFHDQASMASEAPSDDVECFKHSGHTIFEQFLVDKYCKEYGQDPLYRGDIMQLDGQPARLAPKDPDGLLWVWQYADATETEDRYMVVVDVGGRSSKADYSVITVVDRWPLRFGGKIEVVARWRGHIRYDFLALKSVMIARLYCNALLVFESNTFDLKRSQSTEFVEGGDHTRGILSTIEDTYENLYMRDSSSPEDLKIGRYKKIGFQTNAKTKQDMVDLFMSSFEDNTKFLEHDRRAYQEMAIYEQREDGSYGNIVGRDNHDDILMTDMIALLISESMPMPTIPERRAYDGWDMGTINESLL